MSIAEHIKEHAILDVKKPSQRPLVSVRPADLLAVERGGRMYAVAAGDIAAGYTTELTYGSFSWDMATSSPAAVVGGPTAPQVTTMHKKMRRCIVNDAGERQYYLHPTDSSKKEDGTPATLDGTHGQVMVEVPKFYSCVSLSGSILKFEASEYPRPGLTLDPAFVKDGMEVDYRYYGAYDACFLDATDGLHKSGLNLDNASSLFDLNADKLASVAGAYPLAGATRANFRKLAANRGAFWHQLDFSLFVAVRLLYLIEYQTFYSQNILGAGNTNGGYLASSALQSDSPHTIAGASNALGNGSTNTTTGAGVNVKPGTSFMSYRGIENFFGNCWNFLDGINVNIGVAGTVYWTNDRRKFADDTSVGMQLISSTAPTTSGYISAISPSAFLIASSVVGGSSSTFLTDNWYGSTALNRVVLGGGNAANAAAAGVCAVGANAGSAYADRYIGGRLAG